MIKCVALLRKHPHVSREEFIEYYETKHAPLVLSLLPGIVEYRRSFVQRDGAFPAQDGSPIDFDVVTEIWLPDREAHQRFLARAAEPEIAQRLAEDEAVMCDGTATRMVIVDEHASPIGGA
ncbi:MAG: EthD domain-containing protein [Novosphingobium sp.]|nr:EthD domain-containing protein [Novosphingobium sp.]